MESSPRRAGPALALAAVSIAFALLGLHTLRYLPFISDDAFISLRYAQRFMAGHGLTWNDGERVEGYSNLLWVLLSAALGGVGLDLVTAVRVLGFACAAATFAAILYAYPPRTLKRALPSSAALLFLALSAPFAVWTIGGMEQPLVAALLAWAVVLAFPLIEDEKIRPARFYLTGLLLALLCLTRLDGPLFTAAMVAAFFLTRGLSVDTLRRAMRLAFLPVIFVALQQAFRVTYYGEWIPNTALVKFNPSGQHALDGWGYVRGGLSALWPLFALAAAAAFLSFRFRFRRSRTTLITTLVLAWLAYLVIIGGDIFPAWRHFVPLIVLCALLVAHGCEWVLNRDEKRTHLRTSVAVLTLALFVFVPVQWRDSENSRAISERWEWDGEVIGKMLRRAFAEERPLMAVDPAGALPFWSELPTLDMLGLNDHYLPRHPPPGFGRGPIAHELGDGKYVLDRQPDLVVFLLPTGAEHGYFLSGRQMQRDPRFFRDYTLVRFEGREPYRVISQIWVRRHSERIGIESNDRMIVVPAFLLNGNQETTAHLNADGRLVVTATKERPALVNLVRMARGRWRINIESSDPRLRVRVTPAASTQMMMTGDVSKTDAYAAGLFLLDAQAPAVLDLNDKSGEAMRAVNIELTPLEASGIEIHRITLMREDE